ncbi:MAG: acetolactate synthase small subunit [Aureispira sp.]|nr:acetolactate synthase small subunit [Aureispira sp.]
MQRFTISVFTEDFIGLLNRVSIVFTRRHLNIESITASESEVKGVHRYTIVLRTTEEQVQKVVKQLERLVDVLKAFYHANDDTIYQEIALYKLNTDAFSSGNAEMIVRQHHARILSVTKDYTVIEKTGHKEDTQALFTDLETIGVLEFARSGRVSITKPMKSLATYLNELEALN